MIKAIYREFRIELLLAILIFWFAISLRMLYQYEAIVDNPIRGDSWQYFFTAYNLHRYNAFSDDVHLEGKIPRLRRTDLSPGYPVFLSFFMNEKLLLETCINRILAVQAILGALTSVMVFIITRLSLPLIWAVFAGIVTAIDPHLIAIDGYILTESLFAFLVTAGILTFILSWRYQMVSASFLAGIIFTFSYLVRPVNQLLFFIIFLYSVKPIRNGFERLKWKSMIAAMIIGATIVLGWNHVFLKHTATDASGRAPTEIYSSTTGFWRAFLYGTYPGILDEQRNFLRDQDPELPQMLKNKSYAFKILRDRVRDNPMQYLKWYLGGKILFLWEWDHVYGDDVYIYPMIRKPFEENRILTFFHRIARSLHWPLYCLTLLAPIIMLILLRKNQIEGNERLLLLPVCVFLYYIVIFTILQPTTRYGIPVHPPATILAFGAMFWLIKFFRKYRPCTRSI